MHIKIIGLWWAIIVQWGFTYPKNNKNSPVTASVVGTVIGASVTKNIQSSNHNNRNKDNIIEPLHNLFSNSDKNILSTIIIHYSTKNSEGKYINKTINGNDFFKNTSNPIANEIKEIIQQTDAGVIRKINEALQKQQDYIEQINNLFQQLLIHVNYKIAEDYFEKAMKNNPSNTHILDDTRKKIVNRLIKKMTAPSKNVFTDRIKKTTEGKPTIYIHEKTPLKKGAQEFTITIDNNFFINTNINLNNNHDNNNLLDKIEEINSLCMQIIELLTMFNTGEKKFFFRFIIPDDESKYN